MDLNLFPLAIPLLNTQPCQHYQQLPGQMGIFIPVDEDDKHLAPLLPLLPLVPYGKVEVLGFLPLSSTHYPNPQLGAPGSHFYVFFINFFNI